MTITESKLKTGTLTLGGESFACQAQNVRITPTYNETGDALEVLCGDQLAPSKTRGDTLTIVAIQDFTDPDGFQKYLWDNDLETVAFSWKPNAVGPTFTGNVELKAPEIGGDVNVRLTTEIELLVVGAVTWTPAA